MKDVMHVRALIESVCREFRNGEMEQPLAEGLMAFCESDGRHYSSDRGYLGMKAGAWDGDDYWTFDGDSDIRDAYLLLNLDKWVRAAGLADTVPAGELEGLATAWADGVKPFDDFGYATMNSWYTRPSFYDPGDGESHITIDEVPSEDVLRNVLEATIDEGEDRCPVLKMPEVRERLLALTPEIHEELRTYRGYEG